MRSRQGFVGAVRKERFLLQTTHGFMATSCSREAVSGVIHFAEFSITIPSTTGIVAEKNSSLALFITAKSWEQESFALSQALPFIFVKYIFSPYREVRNSQKCHNRH